MVFGASAAVLVVEIVALRLLAPYLGLTLETSTLVIGTALAAIATGAWSGGKVADRRSPRGLIGPLLAVSGVAVAFTPVTVRATAEALDPNAVFVVAAVTIMVPGALLAAGPAATAYEVRAKLIETMGQAIAQIEAGS